jgi:transposase-like protein
MALMGKFRAMYMRQGKTISEISRLTSLSRNTIKKWLKVPQGTQPKYRRPEGQAVGRQYVEVASAGFAGPVFAHASPS